MFGVCFTGTFWGQARSSNRATKSLINATDLVVNKTESLTTKTDTLDGLVRQLHTLPPRGFLETYRDAIPIAYEAFYDATESTATRSEVEEAIRAQLMCVLGLARAFDKEGDKARYGCNLMVFRNAADLSDSEAEAIDQRLKFVDQGVTVKKLEGALDLLLPLSVSSDASGQPDARLKAFALPIGSRENGDHSLDGILPGAPLAWAKRAEAVIESPDDWLSKSSLFSSQVQKEMEAFFSDRSHELQSFASIPLYCALGNNVDNPIGVLNFHRNRPNPLLAEKMELFAPLLVPIASLTGRLLWIYLKKWPILNSLAEVKT